MGVIAVTTMLKEQSAGALRERILACKLSASYATGGDTLALKDAGLASGFKAFNCDTMTVSGTYRLLFRRNKLTKDCNQIIVKVLVDATGSEVANATNLSAEIFGARAEGY